MRLTSRTPDVCREPVDPAELMGGDRALACSGIPTRAIPDEFSRNMTTVPLPDEPPCAEHISQRRLENLACP